MPSRIVKNSPIFAALPGGETPAGGTNPKGKRADRAKQKRLACDVHPLPIVADMPPSGLIEDRDLKRLLEEVGIEPTALDAMTPAEKAYFRQCLTEMQEQGSSHTLKSMISTDYKWQPVSCKQFLEDPYYFGSHTKEMFPACKQVLIDVFDHDKPPVEVVLGGALGWGKTTLAAVGMGYDIYRMTCLVNPHAFYGLMAGSKIVFACYSVSKDQAADSAFSKIVSWIEACPYFLDKAPRIGNHTTRALFRGCPLLLITGSQEIHSIGKDMFAFMLDEANFLTAKSGEDEQSRAYAIYTNAKDRLRSRFMDSDGEIPGKVWLISSKRTHSSFLEKHIADAKKIGDIEARRTLLYEYSQWAVRDPARFKKPKFRVEIGDRVMPHRILPPGEDPRPGAEVIVVPGEYRESFEKNIDDALRNMAGVATDSMFPLFRDKNCIIKAGAAGRISHPFTKPEITTDINDDVGIDTYFRPEVMFQTVLSRYVMRHEPDAPRFVHVDVAFTQDAMGIAMVHQCGWKMCRRVRNDGTYYEDQVPQVVVDFVLRIVPPRGSEIDLAKMRAFLISLRDLGVPIHRVTLDGHQGRDTMQLLRKLEFDAVLYSVDKTDEAYMTLRQAYVEGRIELYPYPTLERELRELERNIDEGTVDHPKTSPETGERGSKDVGDALAGAVFQCLVDVKAHVAGRSPDTQSATITTAQSQGGALPWHHLDKDAK